MHETGGQRPALAEPEDRYGHAVSVRLIGYWRSDEEPGWPDPRHLVDETWDEEERDVVASYLSQGFVPWALAGVSTCRLCGKVNGSAELTDGVYLWPEGLAHYVRDHSVRLPSDVVQHIRARVEAFDQPEVDQDWWREVTQSDSVG